MIFQQLECFCREFQILDPKINFISKKIPYVACYESWGGLVSWFGFWATFWHVCHGKKIILYTGFSPGASARHSLSARVHTDGCFGGGGLNTQNTFSTIFYQKNWLNLCDVLGGLAVWRLYQTKQTTKAVLLDSCQARRPDRFRATLLSARSICMRS